MKLWQKNVILTVIVILISAAPLAILKDAHFEGSDGQAEEAVAHIAPDYKPWYDSVLVPASGEVESLLFALQAALGAGAVGFILGRITRRGPEGDKN